MAKSKQQQQTPAPTPSSSAATAAAAAAMPSLAPAPASSSSSSASASVSASALAAAAAAAADIDASAAAAAAEVEVGNGDLRMPKTKNKKNKNKDAAAATGAGDSPPFDPEFDEPEGTADGAGLGARRKPTVADLRAALAALRISSRGTKDSLAKRLRKAVKDEKAAVEACLRAVRADVNTETTQKVTVPGDAVVAAFCVVDFIGEDDNYKDEAAGDDGTLDEPPTSVRAALVVPGNPAARVVATFEGPAGFASWLHAAAAAATSATDPSAAVQVVPVSPLAAAALAAHLLTAPAPHPVLASTLAPRPARFFPAVSTARPAVLLRWIAAACAGKHLRNLAATESAVGLPLGGSEQGAAMTELARAAAVVTKLLDDHGPAAVAAHARRVAQAVGVLPRPMENVRPRVAAVSAASPPPPQPSLADTHRDPAARVARAKTVFDGDDLPQYYCVLDVEATCDDTVPRGHFPNEIIEFPVVLVSRADARVVTEFRRFVRPVLNPVLTKFCVGLTGIRQAEVDAADTWVEVLREFEEWLERWVGAGFRRQWGGKRGKAGKGRRRRRRRGRNEEVVVEEEEEVADEGDVGEAEEVGEEEDGETGKGDDGGEEEAAEDVEEQEEEDEGDAAGSNDNTDADDDADDGDATSPDPTAPIVVRFATDGPWDIRDFVAKQCKLSGLPVPRYMRDYLDVRKRFRDAYPAARRKKARRRVGGGLAHMCEAMFPGEGFQGRQHSGIDDTRNVARVVCKMVRDGVA